MIQNPILKGFCPDPSIIRVGEDYYLATSTFEWFPGVRLWHSKDLKNWEQLPGPLNRTSQLDMLGDPNSGGVWAPDISYDGEYFYLIFTDVKTKKGRYYNNHNYIVRAKDIRGPWSEPVYVNSTGFDPSILHDTDGRKYVVNMRNGFKGVLVQEYDPEAGRLLNEPVNVFRGTERGFTEGPHIYHIGDWYYVLAAEGGTGYGHCVTMARSRSLFGPYEVDPENPMLTSDTADMTSLQRCGHADIVETQFGEWYMVHLCSRPQNGEKKSLLGRETGIQKVYWNEEGWLRLSAGGNFAENQTESPKGIPEQPFAPEPDRDDFDAPVLGVRYFSPRLPLGDRVSLSERPGWLRLYGQESMNSLHRVSLLAVRQTAKKMAAETCMEFDPACPEQLAGLSYLYDSSNHYVFGVLRDDEGVRRLAVVKTDWLTDTDLIEPIALPEQSRIWLRIESDGDAARCLYSPDGETWTDTGAVLDTSILTDEYARGFTGAHFGLYCHDMTGKQGQHADFDYFTAAPL